MDRGIGTMGHASSFFRQGANVKTAEELLKILLFSIDLSL